ncbi:alpha-L-rhamnosidase [Colletotrichum fioriniae PJ7]|uniref:Alpha-L-rhamnosidase n=1 Tax=Colletotrichum fioriniae PJ7 TaxID=1445577 RepID=A0A010RGW8_9PEZI|nr:alpha-L-rhamnosidase [Colletotrichum fioriniae PJ7]
MGPRDLTLLRSFPTFEVISASGDTSSFEISFAESKAALDSYMSDGTLPLAAAMDTYRVNQYNITVPLLITNRLIQGAFRYQKLNLSSAGSLQLRNIGVKPTTSNIPVTQLPGSFECSDEDLTRVWTTGARTVQLTEIPNNSIPDFLQISDEGAYAESQAPQGLAGAVAAQLLNYRLDIQAKPVKGGFGVSVPCDTLNSCVYLSFNLDSHTITAHAGSTSLDALLATSPLPVNTTLGAWHDVHIDVAMTSITVTFNALPVLNLTQTSRYFGSFGFGASFGHAAYFRNLISSTPTGETIYTNPLTSPSFLSDFMMNTNPADTIVDGSRTAPGATESPTRATSTWPSVPPSALAQNYEMRGNITFAKHWAPKVSKMLNWADSPTLPNGLFNLADESFGGDWNYYDTPQSGVVTKFNVVYAYALQQSLPLLRDAGLNTTTYQTRLDTLRSAINTNLWNPDLNAYILSSTFTTGFAQDANALAILANVPPSPIATASILSTLASDLILPTGPLAFSNSTTSAGFAQKISPYASSYHLRAALSARDASTALTLLKTLWAPMADPKHENYTGCFWETLNPDGTPGLGVITSLCHGWAAGPTAELSRYVLGIQPVAPGFAEWKVEPQTLGLGWAKGRYPTVRGDIAVAWRFEGGMLRMVVESPAESKGTIYLPEPLVTSLEESVIWVNGDVKNGTQFEVNGGDTFVLTQEPLGAGLLA